MDSNTLFVLLMLPAIPLGLIIAYGLYVEWRVNHMDGEKEKSWKAGNVNLREALSK